MDLYQVLDRVRIDWIALNAHPRIVIQNADKTKMLVVVRGHNLSDKEYFHSVAMLVDLECKRHEVLERGGNITKKRLLNHAEKMRVFFGQPVTIGRLTNTLKPQ